ncbi:MAG: sigma-54-dependent Fis family transcriptional regulator [Candidatus Aureabacteria bacterium]|nr:sigma-54-dependent Fis family transcriptional regulator [Candidatus Auribacterota bacterium]
MRKNIFLVDDDTSFLKLTRLFLQRENWECDAFASWEAAKSHYEPGKYSIVLIDLNIGTHNGLEIVEEIKKQNPSQAVVIITGNTSLETVVLALRLGVCDYLTKPCENEEILLRIENLYRLITKDEEISELKREISGKYQFHQIITQDEKMKKLFQLAKIISPTDTTVLIQGETGTGKELFARAIHHESPRHIHDFIVVNCAGLNENLLESHLFGHMKGAFTGAFETVKGKFELVGNGTIFLDEISETSSHFQKKLLRVLQERTFERVGDSRSIECKARVIAATNKNLKVLVEKGDFREDLFFRLNVVPMQIPPLRERQCDIPLLANHFIENYSKKFNKSFALPDENIFDRLLNYPWPGNIRELEHYIEKAVLMSPGNIFTLDDIPVPAEQVQPSPPKTFDMDYESFMNHSEKSYFEHLLRQYNDNIAKIAGHGKITKKTVYAKMKLHSLKWKE